MSTTPLFIKTPRNWQCLVSTANTNLDGSGSGIVSLLTGAAAPGSRLDSIIIQALTITTRGMIRLFMYNGTNTGLFTEIPVSAVPSLSGPTKAFHTELRFGTGIYVEPTFIVKVTTHIANTFLITGLGGDF